MEWVVLDKNALTQCPINGIFLHKDKYWFEGTLNYDSEYGYCISIFESYVGIDGITHYLIPVIS